MHRATPLVFSVATDADTGWLGATWDDPSGGGVTTQAPHLEQLIVALNEAMACHFDAGDPRLSVGFKLRFADEPVLAAS